MADDETIVHYMERERKKKRTRTRERERKEEEKEQEEALKQQEVDAGSEATEKLKKRKRESKEEREGERKRKKRESKGEGDRRFREILEKKREIVEKQREFVEKEQKDKEEIIAFLADRVFESAKSRSFLGVSDGQKAVNLVRACYEMPDIEDLVQQFSSKDVQEKAAAEIWAEMHNYGYGKKRLQVFDTKVFARAFKAPFRNLEGRLESLLQALDSLISYAKGNEEVIAATSVLQSSGTGKSRSFVELSTLDVFVCYCSFQKKSGSPLRTPLLADKLLSDQGNGEAHCRAYIRSWLQCLARYLKGEIVLLGDEGGASSSTSAPPCKSKKWTADHVILEEYQSSLILREVAGFWDLKPDCTEEELVSTWGKVQPLLHRDGVQIVFVFDEAALIFSDREEVGWNLRRVFLGTQLWAVGIFVDTCSKLPLLAPSPEMDRSLRIRSGKVIVPNPIWKISNVNSLISNGLDESESRLGLPLARNKLYRYGRPLWASFMDSMMAERKTNDQVVSEVEQFAATKLCGGVNAQRLLEILNGEGLKHETAIAILGARLVLDVQPHSKLAVDLVANHMSFVLHISSNRTALATCEAWDPVITAAACKFFESDGFRLAALKKLAKAVQESWVDEGKNGEIIARYLLTRAADKARGKNHVMYLESFLQVLCGDDIRSKEMKTSIKDQFTGDEEKSLLARGLLNFKGFHSVIGYTPSVCNLMEFFKLEKAIICKCNQVKLDIILPALLPHNDKYILKPEFMSAVVVQVKSINGKVKLHYEASTGMNPVGIIGGWKREQPFASVLMQLGATVGCRAEVLHVERRRTRSGGASDGIHTPFIIYGLESMYVFLSDSERSQLYNMIHCRRYPLTVSGTVEFAKSIMPLAFEH